MYSPLQLAESFISAGELDDALIALNEHLAAQPDDAIARRLRIDVLLRLPNPNRAREALADLQALPELTEEDLVTRCGALLPLGGDVETALEQGYRRYPNNFALADLVLTILYRRGTGDQALELLVDLPKTWQWQRWRGDFYALKGEYHTAADQYSLALDQLGQADPNILRDMQRATVLLKRAEVYRRLKQFVDAEADYRAAEAIVPDDPMIPFNRGLLIVEQGNLRGALPLCRDALDRAPDALRDLMRDVLYGDQRYHMLAQALLS